MLLVAVSDSQAVRRHLTKNKRYIHIYTVVLGGALAIWWLVATATELSLAAELSYHIIINNRDRK